MVNFGPLAPEMCWRIWGTPANFNGFRVLAALLHDTLVVGVSQTLRRWAQGATCIRHWALDHILVCDIISLSVLGQPLPPDHCPVCLSVTVVYWGPTVGWIKMNQLGMEVGHGPSHIVLNGDPAPNFWPMSVVAKRLDKWRFHWYGGRPRPRQQCVRWITLH